MSLITLDELLRGGVLVTFGGAAGMAAMLAPGTPLWALPAAIGVACGAATVPEVREEVRRALPLLQEARPLLAAPVNAVKAIEHWRRTGELPARPALALQAGPAPATKTRTQKAPGAELFEALEGSPHRLIIGHTRGGKTTLIHHMATEWAQRGERVLVGDPDAAPGLWPGCEVRGHGDNVAAIGELLQVVAGEVEQRRQLRAQGVRRFEPLHLVIDEAQDVLPVIEGGLELFEDVARRGGKLNVRMTVGVQDKQVRTLGLKGKSEVLRNLQVADVLKNREGQRVAVLRDAETGEKVSMPIPPLLDPETLIVPPAAVPSAPATATTQNLRPAPAQAVPAVDLAMLAMLDEMLAAPVPSVTTASQRPENAQGATATATPASGDGNGSAAAEVTVTPPGSGAVVKVYATATAAGGGRARRGRGLDMKARRARATTQRQDDALRRAYADARANGVPSFRQAYKQLGGNSKEALAAWQAAAPEPAKAGGAE